MKCKECNMNMMVLSNTFKSEEGTEEVYSVQKLGCTNAKCKNFVGKDTNNTEHVETVKHIVN